MPKQDLESRLTELTREFVAQLVREIRNASFADVAALPGLESYAPAPGRAQARASGKTRPAAGEATGPRARRSAAGRAELGEQVLAALARAGRPMGVRDLSSALGILAEALAAPLRELRTAGRIRKHGDKRATKYSAS